MRILRDREFYVYSGLFIVLFLIRLPSFFFSVFDWDESTLILMGQSILDGNIPYVTAWDIKPPLAFYMYATFIILFGKSLAAVRLGGMICIYGASILAYKTGKEAECRTAGIIAALFLMVFVSVGYSGLSTMTEHILLVPVSWALYVLIAHRMDTKALFFTGLLLGMGILTKTSLIFESLAVLAIMLSGHTNPGMLISVRMKKTGIMILGMVIPFCVILFYYGISNALDILIRTNVNTILQYTGRAASLPEKSKIFLSNISDNIKLNPLMWITFIFSSLYLFIKERRRETMFVAVPLIVFASQMISLFLTAQPFGYHYLFTSMPAMALISGVFLSRRMSEQRTGRAVYIVLLIAAVGLGFFYSLQGSVVKYYGELRADLIEKRPLGDDACSRIARFLNTADVRDHYIYMVNSCQIVYWLTGSRCPTKYIHPSNLLIKEYMLKIVDGPETSGEKELHAILGKHPRFIVQRNDLWPEDLKTFKNLLDMELATAYDLVKTVDARYEIYERKN